jgi:Rrf2 family protein
MGWQKRHEDAAHSKARCAGERRAGSVHFALFGDAPIAISDLRPPLTQITINVIVLCMQLSMRTDYALRALFSLADEDGRGPVPIVQLARRNDIPKRFLEHIMLELKSGGWVTSVAGKRGGYVLARKPEEITMGEVVRHFDGALAPIGCVSASHYKPCSQESVCRFRRVLLDARNMVTRLMDTATLATVMKGLPVTRAEVLQGMDGEGI